MMLLGWGEEGRRAPRPRSMGIGRRQAFAGERVLRFSPYRPRGEAEQTWTMMFAVSCPRDVLHLIQEQIREHDARRFPDPLTLLLFRNPVQRLLDTRRAFRAYQPDREDG